MREKGVKVGVVKVSVFRPFPANELRAALKDMKAVAVMDRAESFGAEGGPLYLEVKAAMYDAGARMPIVDYVYGLGGADVRLELIETVIDDLQDIASGGGGTEVLRYLGTR
jgi:pyruvate ferredoxin oxidoreductase alpha subunit